jgi:hypothetical protein
MGAILDCLLSSNDTSSGETWASHSNEIGVRLVGWISSAGTVLMRCVEMMYGVGAFDLHLPS